MISVLCAEMARLLRRLRTDCSAGICDGTVAFRICRACLFRISKEFNAKVASYWLVHAVSAFMWRAINQVAAGCSRCASLRCPSRRGRTTMHGSGYCEMQGFVGLAFISAYLSLLASCLCCISLRGVASKHDGRAGTAYGRLTSVVPVTAMSRSEGRAAPLGSSGLDLL